MKTLVVIAFALLSTAANALELKGVRLGMKREELQAAFTGGDAGGRPRPHGMFCMSDQFCTVDVGTIAEIPTQLQMRFLDGKVADAYSGSLSPGQFDQVAEALKSKYGPPASSSVTTVQNRVGNTFENPHYVWSFPDGELRASRFMPGAPTLDIAELRISSKEWVTSEEAKRQKRNADL